MSPERARQKLEDGKVLRSRDGWFWTPTAGGYERCRVAGSSPTRFKTIDDLLRDDLLDFDILTDWT